MIIKVDGGSAFPNSGFERWAPEGGMTLRDYFANSALTAFMKWALDQPHFEDYDSASKAAAGYAKSAYLIADAMLEERAK